MAYRVSAASDRARMVYGWSTAAAQRLRFLLDFGYATGLCGGELVGQTLGHVKQDGQGDTWLHLVGKGGKAGKVGMPALARASLNRYLAQRGLPTAPSRWEPATPLLANIDEDGSMITAERLRPVLRRFFDTAAQVIEQDAPAAAEKQRRATPALDAPYHARHATPRNATPS